MAAERRLLSLQAQRPVPGCEAESDPEGAPILATPKPTTIRAPRFVGLGAATLFAVVGAASWLAWGGARSQWVAAVSHSVRLQAEGEIVTIGPSSDNSKCVPLARAVCDKSAANKGLRVNKDNEGADDVFDITTTPDSVCAKRVDKSEGWDMNLQIKCTVKPEAGTQLDVTIGPSSDNSKCVPQANVACDKSAANKGLRANADNAGADDVFHITTTPEWVCATRLDKSDGWDMNLRIKCTVKPDDEAQTVVTIGPSSDNSKCVLLARAACDKSAANKELRANLDNAGAEDAFAVTTYPEFDSVCVKRVDKSEGWGMNLQIKCPVKPEALILVTIGPSANNSKCVPQANVACDKSAANKGLRANLDNAGAHDVWEITTTPDSVCAERVDKSEGWGMNLQIKCTLRPEAPDGAKQISFVPPIPSDLPPGAVKGDAQPFANIALAALGYNMYYADPVPPVKVFATKMPILMDLGLRYPVFATEYSGGKTTADGRHTNPDGFHATVDLGCSTVFTTKTVRDEYEYTSENTRSTSLTVGVEASAGVSVEFPPAGNQKGGGESAVGVKAGLKATAGVSGTLSYKQEQMRSQNELRDQRMERSTAECASYVAALEFGDLPRTHPDFQAAVKALDSKPEKYWDLFDRYGTHFLTTVQMGARYTVGTYIRNDKYDEMATKVEGLGVGVGATAGVLAGVTVRAGPIEAEQDEEGNSILNGTQFSAEASAEADLLSPEEVEAADTLAIYVQKQEISSVGARMTKGAMSDWITEVGETPVPIKFDKRLICQHPVFDSGDGSARKACETNLAGYCQGRLKPRLAECNSMGRRECTFDLDCEATSVCRKYKCVKVPICEVTLCAGALSSCGHTYTLPHVTYPSAAMGREYDLYNGDWADEVSSVILSDGCEKVELVDDDGDCDLGKADNGRYTESTDLFYDLDNDVCKIKIWAKPPPSDGYRRLAGAAPAGNATGEVPGLAELNRRLGARRRARLALKAEGRLHGRASTPAGEAPARASAPPYVTAVQVAEATRAFEEVMSSMASNETAARRLQGAGISYVTIGDASFIKNIGKAMYGYNNFLAAPLSVNSAGTDPGFRHRPLWKATYTKGGRAHIQDFTEIPKVKSGGKETVITIGSSAEHTKCVPIPGAACDKEAGNRGARVNLDFKNADDSWDISTTADQVCAKRIDRNDGWGMNLQIRCTVTHQDWVYNTVADTYLHGYAAGDLTERDLISAQARCTELLAACGGVTCATPGASCTVRESTDTSKSPTGEVSYIKAAGKAARRRLLADDAPHKGYHLGPPRMLTVGPSPPPLLAPDGWKVTMSRSTICEKGFSTKQIKSDSDYDQEQQSSFSLPNLNLGPVSFSLSSEMREFRKRNSKERKAMFSSKAECLDYFVEIEDLANAPPPISDSFQLLVNLAKAEEEFYALFGMFGLLFPTKVMFGARYGYTRYIDEESYQNLEENSDGMSVSAGVTLTAEVAGGLGEVAVSAEAGQEAKSNRTMRQNVQKYFREVREFAVGQKVPRTGGVDAWVNSVGGEPMPIKFGLVSICQHPAFAAAGTRADCEKYAQSFCPKYLTRWEVGITCTPQPAPECLWDLDCDDHHTCTADRKCVQEPDCTIEVYSLPSLTGQKWVFGPIYRRQYPNGFVWDLGSVQYEIRSAKVTGGCEEVTFMDQDVCMEQYEDNLVQDLRRSDDDVVISSFKDDLEEDVCKIKVLAKDTWVAGH